MTPKTESDAMEEVWRIKRECAAEVAHLNTKEALHKRLADSRKNASELGFNVFEKQVSRAAKAA